jgi:hypothetical protein
VIVRGKKFKPEVKKVFLDHLESPDHFQGKYFRVLKGHTDEVVSFTDEQELVDRAANAYYHLSIAREYFSELVFADHLDDILPINVRVGMTRGFHGKFHFKGAAESLQEYNNAKSIPPGEGSDRFNIKPWNYEIWFRPSRPIHIKELGLGSGQFRGYDQIFSAIKKQYERQSYSRFLVDVVSGTERFSNSNYFSTQNFLNTSLRTGGAIILLELLWQYRDKIGQFFSPRYFYLDSAMVPEVIYHEFAHIALADNIALTHSKPVIEGVADYFASRISNSPKLANKIKKFAKIKPKNGKNKSTFTLDLETQDNANADFVLALFWDLKQQLGDEVMDRLIISSIQKLSDQSDIRFNLTRALIKSCRDVCEMPERDLWTLRRVFRERGL